MISIISLIYRSPIYADAVYNSVYKHTPKIKTGEAEFFFIANDPTDELLNHLITKNYHHIVNRNPVKSEAQLHKEGIGKPAYINRVYRGWNVAINNSSDITVLINSDHLFSSNWLENLYKHLSKNVIVCSQLVERAHMKFPTTILGDFGSNPKNFKEKEFLTFAKIKQIEDTKPGGVFMPCMFYKDVVQSIGGYPEGNVIANNGKLIYGDQYMFNKLAKNSVRHITALDSIVYHFKEGEMRE